MKKFNSFNEMFNSLEKESFYNNNYENSLYNFDDYVKRYFINNSYFYINNYFDNNNYDNNVYFNIVLSEDSFVYILKLVFKNNKFNFELIDNEDEEYNNILSSYIFNINLEN